MADDEPFMLLTAVAGPNHNQVIVQLLPFRSLLLGRIQQDCSAQAHYPQSFINKEQ
jgi:hypothetical protein